MNARYYDPFVRRFVSVDTIVPDTEGPQSLNRYAYAVNNPIVFLDPSGHWSCTGREDCEDIVNTWIGLLGNAGEPGQDIAIYFVLSDIEVAFIGDFAGAMRTGAWNNNLIEVDNPEMGNLLAEEGFMGHVFLFTQFGHELEHARQGWMDSRSIQGEYFAYETQFTLAEEFDANFNTSIATDMLIGNGSPITSKRYYNNFADWYDLGVNLDPYSYSDMSQFKETYFDPGSLYSNTPILSWPAEITRQFMMESNLANPQWGNF